MKKFGEIKSKILSKLVESYSSKNENEIKSILKILKEDKNFKEMYLFYEQIENMEFSNPESVQVYVEMVEPMLIEKSESIQKICKKLNEHVGEVDYEKNEIYECLDTLSEKSSISNLDKKITARKKLIEHLKKEKKQEVVETKIPHTTNQKLLATILSNNFNMIYESKFHPPIPPKKFILRMVIHGLFALILLIISLALGMSGYMYYEKLSLSSAFVNSAMLLGGMGPVNNPVTESGKVFAGFYALYSGLIFLIVAALMLAPTIHRIMHKFNWNEED